MDEGYDPLSHYSTALSLLPRTLAGVGFSLPVGLSEVDQMKAFFDHMHNVLKKDQNSGIKSLEKYPGPNPITIGKEGDEVGKKCSEEQRQDLKSASLEPMEMEPQPCTNNHTNWLSTNLGSWKVQTDEEGGNSALEEQNRDFSFKFLEPTLEKQCKSRSPKSKLCPNPDTIHRGEIGKSTFEGQQQDVKSEPSEPMQLQLQLKTNSCATGLSPDTDSLQTKRCETRNGSQGQNWDVEPMELQPQSSISSHANKLSSNTNRTLIERDESGNDSSLGKNADTNFESVKATMMEPQPSNISIAIRNKLSLNPDSREKETDKTGNSSFEVQTQCFNFESVDFMEKEQRPSITSHINKISPTSDSMVLEKTAGNINSERKDNSVFRCVESMLEPGLSISSDIRNPSQIRDEMNIERNISVKSSSLPVQMAENGKICQRPCLFAYSISPFTLIQKSQKTKQVVPVDFTVLDHISDPDGFYEKAYELEAAVTEIERLGGEPKIIGERIFSAAEDDQPRRRRPGLEVQLQFEFVPLPMRPLPAKVHRACICQNRAPTQSINCPETTKAKDLSGSQNEGPSSISNATKEAPEMNLCSSSSLQRLLSIMESFPEDEEKAVAMVSDCLNLKPTVIPPLVIPEMPKFSRLHAVRSPWRQLPSIERVRELSGEDPLVAFEKVKRKIFSSSPSVYCSDNDTNSPVGLGSVRSLSTSPGCHISFENEEIDTPSHVGPSGRPSAIEDSYEKVFAFTCEARCGKNISDKDFTGNDIMEEPEMGSPGDNSPATEVPVSTMPLEHLPVNTEVAPSNMLLENQPEEEMILKEASSRKGKKRGLDHGDSSFDMHSEILSLTSYGNTETQAENSFVEPLREGDVQIAPPKKRNKKQQKSTRSSIQIIEGGLQEVDGLRRSTRIRSRPLRNWMGERILFANINGNFPTAVGVKECSPATLGIRVKVKSFVSGEHADLVARLAK